MELIILPSVSWMCMWVLGQGHYVIASFFLGSTRTSSPLTMCPKYSIFETPKAHLGYWTIGDYGIIRPDPHVPRVAQGFL